MTTLLLASLALTMALQPNLVVKLTEATLAQATPVVSGTLNYRSACRTDSPQPVGYTSRDPLNTGPFLYLTDSQGNRVSSFETTGINGAFAFSDGLAPGQYQLHLAMGELTQFSSGIEPLSTIPVVVPAAGRPVSVGRVCMDNEKPRLISVTAYFGGNAVTTAAHGMIDLPDYDGPVFFRAETISENHHTVHVAWTATGGEIGGDPTEPVLDWIPGSEVFLKLELTDDFGGKSSAVMPVRLATPKAVMVSWAAE